MECCFERKAPKSDGETGSGCPFADETEFFDVDGKAFCRFHLGMSDDAGQPTAKADWRLDDHKRFFRNLRSWARDAMQGGRMVDFAGVVFPIGFKPAIVFGVGGSIPRITFRQCVFTGKATFRTAAFADLAVFADATFEEDADFRSAAFGDQANFDGATFQRKADFVLVGFMDFAKFENAVFAQLATFESASFGSWTFFTKARFHNKNGTNFDYAAFNNGVFFDGAVFLGRMSFQVRTEQNRLWNVQRGFADDDDVNERQDRNFPQINFKGAVFKDRIDFSNRHFLEATDFSDVVFEVAPEFHNCVLHQDTDFSGAQFKDTTGEHAARTYRTLKLAMGEVRAANEEAMFYAKEQDSLRHRTDTPGSIKLMSWLYMALSDYGRSYVRPLVILALLTAGSSLAYYLWHVWLAGSGEPGNAFTFAMTQVVRPFFVWTTGGIGQSELPAIATAWPLALRLVATAQSIASIGLVTLFLLSLRRRFRLH